MEREPGLVYPKTGTDFFLDSLEKVSQFPIMVEFI